MLREFITGIKNLWAWFPIIWKDRDWDNFYIYEILEFKLKNQSNYIGKMDRHTRAKKDARDMLICSKLISKIKNDDYELEYFDYHESELVFLDVRIISEDFDTYFKKYPKWHKKAIEYIKENQYRYNVDHNDKSLVARTMGDLRQERAKQLLFNIMTNRIDGWWD
jgi:hypothetical protein